MIIDNLIGFCNNILHKIAKLSSSLILDVNHNATEF